MLGSTRSLLTVWPCPANGVKKSPGNATECDVEIMCDGKSYVLNAENATCGNILVVSTQSQSFNEINL